jgi:hypothetical protein
VERAHGGHGLVHPGCPPWTLRFAPLTRTNADNRLGGNGIEFRHTGGRAVRDDLHAAVRGQDGCLPSDVAEMSCLLRRSVRPALPAFQAGAWSASSGTTGVV